MKSLIKKCVIALGMILTTVAGGHAANPLFIDDGVSQVGFYDNGWVNWVTNGAYRVYEKSFNYQAGTMATPAALHLLPQGTPSLPATNRIIRSFSDQAGQFKVTLDQNVSSGQGTNLSARSTLKSLVKIENLTAAPLKFNLSEISSYAITNYFDTDRNNVAVIGNRAFFSNFAGIPLGSLPNGAMVTKTSTLDNVAKSPYSPSSFSIADCSVKPCVSSPTWPMPQNGKPQLNLQWDLIIPANGSFSFNITDDLLPAFPLTAKAGHTPACSVKNSKVTYTISVDNYANNTSQTNTTAANSKVYTVLPSHVSFVSATNGGLYTSKTRTVTWNIGSMTPQSAAKTMQLTISNPTDRNVSLQVVPSSDNLYPNIVADTAKSCTNNPPKFVTPMFATSAKIGIPFSYQVKATDPNDDKITYSLSCASTVCPANMKIDPVSGLITGLVTDVTLLNTNITFFAVATDDRGATTKLGAILSPINNIPVFQTPYSATLYAGQNFSFQSNAIDADGHSLTYSFPAAVPAGMTITNAGLIEWNPAFVQIGNSSVTVRVSDSWSSKDQIYPFTVLNPVSISSTPPSNAKIGTLYTYQIVAANTLSKPLTYTIVTGPTGMTIDGSGIVNWTPTSTQLGLFPVTFKVSDGIAEKTQSANITVTSTALPYFISTPPTQATVGQQYVYLVELGNIGSSSAGCMLASPPTGMTSEGLGAYTPGGSKIIWTPTADQANISYPVTLVCFDVIGNIITQNFTIAVNP